MRRRERVYLINLHETRRHRARPVAVAVRVTLNRSARGVQRMVPAVGRVRRLLLLLLMVMAPRIDGPLAVHRHIVQKNAILVVPGSVRFANFSRKKWKLFSSIHMGDTR